MVKQQRKNLCCHLLKYCFRELSGAKSNQFKQKHIYVHSQNWVQNYGLVMLLYMVVDPHPVCVWRMIEAPITYWEHTAREVNSAIWWYMFMAHPLDLWARRERAFRAKHFDKHTRTLNKHLLTYALSYEVCEYMEKRSNTPRVLGLCHTSTEHWLKMGRYFYLIPANSFRFAVR